MAVAIHIKYLVGQKRHITFYSHSLTHSLSLSLSLSLLLSGSRKAGLNNYHMQYYTKIHSRYSSVQITGKYQTKTKSSADDDKPARRVYRSVKVIKHGSIPYVRYGFLIPVTVL